MVEVVVRNKRLLGMLNSFVDEYHSLEGSTLESNAMYSKSEHKVRGEYYCGEEHLHYMMDNWKTHHGFPEEHYAIPISKLVKQDPNTFVEYRNKVREQFTAEIGAMHSALTNYYPPGGFVGWHTNWNASCYQILFTWSKDGNGYFRYWDDQEKKIVHIQDKPGWQCRHYYFGPKDEPEHHCWHSAYTLSPRITLAYKFDNISKSSPQDAIARAMRDQLIEEIESEE